MDTGVARKPVIDIGAYKNELSARLDATVASLQAIFEEVRSNPRRVVFAEGEEEKSIRAAVSFRNNGYGTPVLIGRERNVYKTMEALGLPGAEDLEIHNAKLSQSTGDYMEHLYERLQRKGMLFRDCQRMVNQDRNVFAACMVALGDADAMVTGLTRNYHVALDEITRVLDPRQGQHVFGLSLLISPGRTLFVSDTAVHELPTAEQLADFAHQTAVVARQMGHEPRVALTSFANFGNPDLSRSAIIRDAVEILDGRDAPFEYDGEMGVDVALNPEVMENYPFCRLSGPANVLIMPGLNSAQLATKLLRELSSVTVIGPLLMGLSKPAQIVPLSATVSEMVNMAALAAHEAAR